MNSMTAMAGQSAEPVLSVPYPAWRAAILPPAVPSLARDGRGAPARYALRLAREPFSARAIKDRIYSIAGFALAVMEFAVVVVALTVSLGLSLSFAGMLLGLPLLVLSLSGARQLGSAHRYLASSLLGLRVEPPPPPSQARNDILSWGWARLADSASWRTCAYLLIRLPVMTLGAVIVASFWIYGVPFLTFPLWWAILHAAVAHGTAIHLTPWLSGRWDPVALALSIHTWPVSFALVPLGAALVLTTPWRNRAAVIMDGALINALLGPASVPQRVRDLEQARARAVDDAAATLRQIERDLHDGAQAQMVAVAMKLGLAREKLGSAAGPDLGIVARPELASRGSNAAHADLERALELVDAAHASARQAISDLRDLARGIHPPVLDHGLGTALATLAASSGVPVDLVTDLPERASAAIETIAYFCAAELIANVAKHSGARHATLEAVHVPGLLRVRVRDDGAGGARIAAGGGLAGLADRVRTVDGKLEIDSPPGGPTVVTVELPSHV